jgi:drug/metabolite transporter (DMT)-like permease
MPLLIVALSAFLMGVRMTKLGQVAFLDTVPGVGMIVKMDEEPVVEE